MKNKKLFKVISIILVVIMLLHIVPQSVIAFAVEKVNVNKSIGNEISNQEDMTSKIVSEVTELRNEYEKHFACEDGSFVVATYNDPVHYKENGQWKEIDNSLRLTADVKSSSGKSMYTPKAGIVDVKIPQSFSNGQKVSATNKGYTISFGANHDKVIYQNKPTAVVKDVEDLSSSKIADKSVVAQRSVATTATLSTESDIATFNNDAMAVDNQAGAVVYENVFGNDDLEYIVTTNSIKENIVVNEKQDNYIYSFNMDFGELTPIVNEDNSIRVVNPEDTEETIFYIEAPYMYDANEIESTNIEMSLVEEDGIYIMTLQADTEWMNDSERVFPVVIDPTVYLSFDDVFVMDGLSNKNTTKINKELRVGRNLTNLARTYIKPTVPTNILTGSYISSAYLNLIKDYYYQAPFADDISIRAYDCYDVKSWSPTSVTWENQPYSNSDNGYSSGHTYLSSVSATSIKSTYSFSITDAVRRWLDGGVNNGIMLASSNESTKTQIDFHSSRTSDSNNYPKMYITYTTPTLSVSTWETDSQVSEKSFTIKTGKDWTASTDADWISLSATSGTPSSGSSTNKIIVTENTSVGNRIGTVTVKIGNTIIGTITVTQLGCVASIVLSEDNFFAQYEGMRKDVEVISNINWEVNTADDWITVEEDEIAENDKFSITVSPNDAFETRVGKITISSTEIEPPIVKEIKITQLDQLSDYFCEINSENTAITLKNPNEYNHPMATWAMYLSYIVYNPVPDGLAQVVPGAFIENSQKEKTINMELSAKGFDGIKSYNTNDNNAVAHTIAYKKLFDENGNAKTLVVVTVRGSVTFQDWILNLNTQLNPCGSQFEDGSEMVLSNLFSYDWYQEDEPLGETIILVTGHSLGAAVANLTAKHLNSCEDSDCEWCGGESADINDVYAYTFATPYTKEGSKENFNNEKEYAKSLHLNIFNILNNNDVVIYVPLNLKSFDWDDGRWFRYGQDIHITMPMNIEWLKCLDTAWLGLGGHAMPTYNQWIQTLPDRLGMDAEDISLNDLPVAETTSEAVPIGILPKFIKVKCPVGVRLYDDDNNIVASENVIYEDIIDENVSNNGGISDDINDLNNIVNTSGIISWTTDEDEKIFIIPYDCEDISIHIEAYDYGTMDFVAQTIGLGEPLESKEINDVSLYPGKQFEASVSSDVSIDNVGLFYLKDDGTYEEITDSNPVLKSVVAENTPTTDGIQSTVTITTDKTVTGIKFINRNDNSESVYYVDSTGVVSVVENDDVLVWTIQHTVESESVFDVSVESEGIWYLTERVFDVTMY